MTIFVGDKPSPRMKTGANAFEGARCEKRLRAWIRVVGAGCYITCNSHNETLLEVIRQNSFMGHKIVALGKAASKRLKRKNIPHFEMPHPSGLNRQLNDKSFVAQKLIECKNWLGGNNGRN